MLRSVIKSIKIKITTTLKLLLSHFFKKGCNPKMQNNYFLQYTRGTSLSRVCICKEITVHALQIFVCVCVCEREREKERERMTGTAALVIFKGYIHSSIQPEFQFEEFICRQNHNQNFSLKNLFADRIRLMTC
jgi:hypothetical protein